MLIFVTLSIIPIQATPVNHMKQNTNQNESTIALVSQKPQFTFQNRSYNSGILFEHISNIKISHHSYNTGYYFGIDTFMERINFFVSEKMKIDLHCQNKTYKTNCEYFQMIIDSFISYGEQTLDYLNKQGKITNFSVILHDNLNKIISINSDSARILLHDTKLKQIMDKVKTLMKEQILDSKKYYELFNKLEIKTTKNIFPPEVVINLINETQKLIGSDEELPNNISIDPYNIFSIAIIETDFYNKQFNLRITIPILKKKNFSLYKSHAVPVALNNGNTYVIESNTYFIMGPRNIEFMPIGKNEMSDCMISIDKYTRMCIFSQPPTTIRKNSCQSLLLQNAPLWQIWNRCNFNAVNKTNYILSIKRPSCNHCLIIKPTMIKIKCGNMTIPTMLQTSGILELNPNCNLVLNHTSTEVKYVNITGIIIPQFKITEKEQFLMTTNDINKNQTDHNDHEIIEQILNQDTDDSDDNIFTKIEKTFTSVGKLAYDMGKTIVNSENPTANDISKFIINDINGAVSDVRNALSSAGNTVYNATKNIASETANDIISIAQDTYTSVSNTIQNIIEIIYNIFLCICGVLSAILIIICLIDIFKYGR